MLVIEFVQTPWSTQYIHKNGCSPFALVRHRERKGFTKFRFYDRRGNRLSERSVSVVLRFSAHPELLGVLLQLFGQIGFLLLFQGLCEADRQRCFILRWSQLTVNSMSPGCNRTAHSVESDASESPLPSSGVCGNTITSSLSPSRCKAPTTS